MNAALNEETLRAWSELRGSTPQDVRLAVAELVRKYSGELTDEFYEHMLSHAMASKFLDLHLVNERLRGAMHDWLVALFSVEKSLPDVIHLQEVVGKAHARIRVPMEMIQSGVRLLRAGMRHRVSLLDMDMQVRDQVREYVSDLFCLAGGAMTLAYLTSAQEALRNEVSYRLVTQKRSLSFERVRQRAALSEWAETTFLSTSSRLRRPLPRLRDSEFGVWVHHKGTMLFGENADLRSVFDLIEDMDGRLLPLLQPGGAREHEVDATVESIKQLLNLIRLKLGEMFDQLGAQDEGLDLETQLPDRRYLQAVLSNELRAHNEENKVCSLLIVEIDAAEHQGAQDAGSRSRLLRSVATVIADCSGTGDQLFRFDERRFLLIAVECDRAGAARMAHRIAEEVNGALHALAVHGTWAPSRMGVRIGVAEYDRHPDYLYFLQRAEAALQTARTSDTGHIAFG